MINVYLIAVFLVAYLSFAIYASIKGKAIKEKYKTEKVIEQADKFQTELLQNQFRLLKTEMKNLPIDAFTQCAYIATVGDKVGSAVATAAKTAAWAMVGVKARYYEVDNASYLVLSDNEVHYLFFEEGKPKTHIIIDEETLKTSQLGTISKTEKVVRMSSLVTLDPTKIDVNIPENPFSIYYYNEVKRTPEEDDEAKKITKIFNYIKTSELNGKMSVMGKNFRKKLGAKYPHLIKK